MEAVPTALVTASLVFAAKAQKIEMDKLEKAKKERTKIEFVTGTKKGTTTNATATTTTTASTAVAGRRRIVRLQPHHRWSKGFPALLGASRPRGEVGIPMGVGASAPPCHAFI